MSVRSAILTYHSLDDSGSAISTHPEVFRRQMEFLAASGIPVLPLAESLERPGSVTITFDDGFRNVLDDAVPVLEQYGFPATIFVVEKYCGLRNNWPSQPRGAVPDLPLLGLKELSEMPRSIALGAHTATHPDLTRLSDSESERELLECQSGMEQRLARPVRLLAYPYGASNGPVRTLAAKHFDLALGTRLDFVRLPPDRWDLPRIDTYYLNGRFPLERLFTTTGGIYVGLRRGLRRVKRLVSG
jgi:peptidoglycan/xylan/chitin deacetylase (PgdA/CDA1 family)